MKKTASSFCMCFVPVVSDNGLMVGKGSKKSSSLSLLEVKPLHSPAENMVDSGEKDKDGVGSFGLKNKSGRRSLSRYVKAVFFGTSLMKKMRSKKYKFKSKSKFKSEWLNSMHNNNVTIEDVDHSTRSMSSKFSSCLSKSSLSTNSSSSTLSSSSSSSLRTSSGRLSSASLPYDSKPLMSKTVGNNGVQGKLGKGRHGFNVGVCCLLLVSLLVLVIWGKVCAIFCTSAVLVFANRLITSIKQGPSENIAVDHCMPEIGSEQYKKKIIMEGLLERSHIRNLY